VLDLKPPDESLASTDNITSASPGAIEFTKCDITGWLSLRKIFATVGNVDIAVGNAGISQEYSYFTNTLDSNGELEEPAYYVVEVNYRAVLNFVKLSLSAFHRQAPGGSLVLTRSAAAYSAEQSLPAAQQRFRTFRYVHFPISAHSEPSLLICRPS